MATKDNKKTKKKKSDRELDEKKFKKFRKKEKKTKKAIKSKEQKTKVSKDKAKKTPPNKQIKSGSVMGNVGRTMSKPFAWSLKKLYKPTPRGRNWQLVFLVVLITFLSLNLDNAKYWNKSADYLNKQIEKIPNDTLSKVELPYFYNKEFKYGLDLAGGIELIYKANFDENIDSNNEQLESLDGMRDVLERRVNFFGVSEPEVRTTEFGDEKGIIISLPGVSDTESAKEQIGETPYLDFREEKTQEEQEAFQSLLESGEGINIENFNINDLQWKKTELTGKHIKSAGLRYDQYTGEPIIALVFNSDGKDLFTALTEKNVGKPLGIFLDDVLISAPNVTEKIESNEASITGIGSIDEAEELKKRLNAGALPVEIELVSERSVDATLGQEAKENGIKAGLYGGLIVIAFMLLFYRLPGLFAAISLSIYIAVLVALFKLFNVTLTLSGIAGVVFSIGIAVDANVLIFERMREELKRGRDIGGAVEDGFKRAWSSIRDSNVSTLITCAVLFAAGGAGIMRGFAITLSLGVLVSMFSAITVTRILLRIVSTRFKSTSLF